MKKWVIERLKEKTTWRGFILVATGLGLGITPDMAASIITAGVTLAGAIEVVTKEKAGENGI